MLRSSQIKIVVEVSVRAPSPALAHVMEKSLGCHGFTDCVRNKKRSDVFALGQHAEGKPPISAKILNLVLENQPVSDWLCIHLDGAGHFFAHPYHSNAAGKAGDPPPYAFCTAPHKLTECILYHIRTFEVRARINSQGQMLT